LICSGTPEGDIVIVNSTNMQIQTMIKKAHLGVVTALAFSPDSRFVMNCFARNLLFMLCLKVF
jgi:prolactin regulatory element-binding protein